jgi:hypothetical protein
MSIYPSEKDGFYQATPQHVAIDALLKSAFEYVDPLCMNMTQSAAIRSFAISNGRRSTDNPVVAILNAFNEQSPYVEQQQRKIPLRTAIVEFLELCIDDSGLRLRRSGHSRQ